MELGVCSVFNTNTSPDIDDETGLAKGGDGAEECELDGGTVGDRYIGDCGCNWWIGGAKFEDDGNNWYLSRRAIVPSLAGRTLNIFSK